MRATGGEVGEERGARLRVQVLLALGAAVGLLLAAFGILRPGTEGPDALPADAVARVNDVLIRRPDYERLLAGLETDARSPLDESARRQVVDRMIDEELLVQRALELGLARSDRRVRADLTSNLIASVVSDAEDREPREGELREYHAANQEFFTNSARLRVQQIFFRVPTAGDEAAVLARATAARSEIAAGHPFESVREQQGDREIWELPDVLLPAMKLREYIGPTLLGNVLELEVGAVSQPLRSSSGIHLLRLVEREDPRAPAFEEIEAQVRGEWRRRLGDQALRDYLDALRESQDVVTAEGL